MVNMKKSSLKISFVTACALAAATATNTAATASENNFNDSAIEQLPQLDVYAGTQQAELERALQTIEAIPDAALSDEESFENWKKDNLQALTHTRASIGSCTWGITKALASNIFVFSKVSKLKRVIDAAGGARAVADKAIKTYKTARNEKNMSRRAALAEASEAAAVNGGEQAVSLLLEIFSIDSVIGGCFND